ncbi:MAG: tetratricopeptide repeat protein [Bacteroidota bacterium]
MKKIITAALVIIFNASAVFCQKNLVYQNPEAEYQKGLDLFSKEKYNAALESFSKTIDAISDKQSDMRISAEYYTTICAIELYNNDAEYQLLKFIGSYPENSKVKLAGFQLGKLEYRQKKYYAAAKSFEKMDVYDLNSDDLSEFYCKLGYSYFILKDFDKSKKQFFEIKDVDTKYYGAANYYYAHIAYNNKNYETALKCFLNIENDKDFGPVVPYYIAQIYYLQGKYEEVIKYAPPLLDSANAKRTAEITRILGESYFNTADYKNAIFYLEKYITKSSNTITRQDNYELGYSYYRLGTDYSKATDCLGKVITLEDSLSQSAYYILGDCYLKQDNKKFAKNAFLSSSKMSFYPDIKEDALFNYAKLSYDLALNPYNEAINSFQKYIKTYPTSSKIDEARKYLFNLYLSSKNYKAALASLDSIATRDDQLNQAFQKVAYYRGIELFNNKDISGAIEMFDKSNTQPMDKTVKAECCFWKAEGLYRLSEFDSAKAVYEEFLLLPGAFSLPYYNDAYYNIGYCNFKNKDYNAANKAFRKFTGNKDVTNKKILNDAYLRTGDCYFISKDYSDAIECYNKAIAINEFDRDYAWFQKALCLHAKGKYDQKISTIMSLLDRYPESAYTDDAKYELAGTYLIQNDNESALKYYIDIVKNYPTSNYVKNAYLRIGMIYKNDENYNFALQMFKKVVSDYPATDASKDALVSIRDIYMDIDEVDSFYVYVKNLPFEYSTKIEMEQDSVTYMACENGYFKNLDCEKSITAFSNYLQKFPGGYFIVNANYYKAECEYRNKNYTEALKGYAFIVSQPQSKFTEFAVQNAAEICYELKQYDSAATYYSILETNAEYKSNILDARLMKMRCYWKSGELSKVIEAANSLILTDKVTSEQLAEGYITIGRAAIVMDSTALAQTHFEFACKQNPASEFGAEAKYNLAYIHYQLQDYTNAEKTVFEVINLVPSYDYWITKSFILLAEIYTKTGNTIQAKATLTSIIENSDNAELVTLAHEKLNAILQSEIQEEQQKLLEDIDVKFQNNPDGSEKLLEENNNPQKEENKNE